MKMRAPLSIREHHILRELIRALEEYRWLDVLDLVREGQGIAEGANPGTLPQWIGAWNMCAGLLTAGVHRGERRSKSQDVITYIHAVIALDACHIEDQG